MTRLFLMIGFVVSIVTAGSAQVITPGTSDKCAGKIYSARDVAHRARLIDFKDPTLPREASQNGVTGKVIINAVLCRTGRVTDIVVVKGLPFGVTENAINAVHNLRFAPAELNFHSVSQAMLFEFTFSEFGSSGIASTNPNGRLVEEIYVVGNRRMTKEEIFDWIKTRLGEPYNPTQVSADLQELLKTGYFNRQNTRVSIEDTLRGGIRVIFEVRELPLIAEIAFEGPGRMEPAAIINEVARQGVDLRVGRPFDRLSLKKVTKVIEDYFRAQGWINVKAEASVENLMPTEVRIVFKIAGTNF